MADDLLAHVRSAPLVNALEDARDQFTEAMIAALKAGQRPADVVDAAQRAADQDTVRRWARKAGIALLPAAAAAPSDPGSPSTGQRRNPEADPDAHPPTSEVPDMCRPGRWTDADGASHERTYKTYPRAVMEVARNHAGGMRFHDLRHSYATWLVDDSVPINMVQRVLGHEKSSTTLDIYTRRTDNSARILQALTEANHGRDDDGGSDDDGGAAGVLLPV